METIFSYWLFVWVALITIPAVVVYDYYTTERECNELTHLMNKAKGTFIVRRG